jgi:tryptophan-associated transmembrane protein
VSAAGTQSAPATDRRRAYFPVVILLACAAVAALLGSVTWLTVRISAPGGATALRDTLSGANANPAGVAFALVALVAPVVFLAAGRRVRLAAAVLALFAGLGVTVTAVRVAASPTSTAQHSSKLADAQITSVRSSVWPELQAIAGIGIVASSAAALRRASTWRTMGSKYDAPAAGSPRPPRDDWEALEQGIDPTSDR